MTVKQFKLLSGETVLGTYLGPCETRPECDLFEDTIQLVITDSLENPAEQSVGFAPFPEYNNPKNKNKIEINKNLVVFYIEPDEQFVEQYNKIFGKILTPPQKIFTGK
jgi:hypothetical protein